MSEVLTLDERLARGALVTGTGITEQSHKDACDINKIMRSYAKTGLVPVSVGAVPQIGDFSSVYDFHTASCLIAEAQEAFDALPAELRKEFNFDPGELIAAIEDPAHRERLVRLGVLTDPSAVDATIASAPIPSGGVAV